VSDRALRDQLEALQVELRKARATAERAGARAAELEAQLRTERETADTSSREAAQLRADLADAERAFRHLAASLASTRQERRELEKKLEQLPRRSEHVAGVPDSWLAAVLDVLGLS